MHSLFVCLFVFLFFCCLFDCLFDFFFTCLLIHVFSLFLIGSFPHSLCLSNYTLLSLLVCLISDSSLFRFTVLIVVRIIVQAFRLPWKLGVGADVALLGHDLAE